jgi:hypothetical protein
MVAMRTVQGAAREVRRVPGISFCSGQQYAANALGELDPRFAYAFQAWCFPVISVPGSLRSVAQDLHFGDGRGPAKKTYKKACIYSIRYY